MMLELADRYLKNLIISEIGKYTYDVAGKEFARDITQEKMDAEWDYLQNNPHPGITVVRWNTRYEEYGNGDRNARYKGPIGKQYKDLKTGKLYRLRNYHSIYSSFADNKYYGYNHEYTKSIPWKISFYMDEETGLLVREEDGAYEKIIEDEMKRSIGRKLTEEELKKEIEDEREKAPKWITKHNEKKLKAEKEGQKEYQPEFFFDNLYVY